MFTISSGPAPVNSPAAPSSSDSEWWDHHDRPHSDGQRLLRALVGVHGYVEWRRRREQVLLDLQRSPEQVRSDRVRRLLGERIGDVIGDHWDDFAPVVEDLVAGVWDVYEEECQQRLREGVAHGA